MTKGFWLLFPGRSKRMEIQLPLPFITSKFNHTLFMLKSIAAILLTLAGSSCFAQRPGSFSEKPAIKNLLPNMSYIPSKSFTSLSYQGRDSVSDYSSRISSVHGFHISQTEVTNKEFRQFVHYVRDSMAHVLLLHFRKGTHSVDWSQKIDWKNDRLDALMFPADERLFGKKEIDPQKLLFTIDFFGQEQTIAVYPDTLVWIRDFAYSYNEPLVKNYFSNAAYDNYPVVGICLKQAMAFCQWKTARLKEKNPGLIIRLPTSAEWEAAALGDNDSAGQFSLGNPYNSNFGTITDSHGFTAKGYKDDGYFYTGPVKSYPAGAYGLYDMKGNVAEWTSTSREEIMNMEIRTGRLGASFIVKGGGWDSSPFYLQPGACQFLPADAAHSYTGFRYVVSMQNSNMKK